MRSSIKNTKALFLTDFGDEKKEITMERSLVIFTVNIFIFSLLVLFAVSCTVSSKEKEGLNIPFSHKTHVENYNIDKCETCHTYSVHGLFQGTPTIGECTACHERDGKLTTTDRTMPRKKSIFDNYTDKDKPWKSRPKDQGNVYYSHKVALSTTLDDGSTKLRCAPCHEDKVKSTGLPTLSGGKLMDQCIDCHTTYKMDNECSVCHSRR